MADVVHLSRDRKKAYISTEKREATKQVIHSG